MCVYQLSLYVASCQNCADRGPRWGRVDNDFRTFCTQCPADTTGTPPACTACPVGQSTAGQEGATQCNCIPPTVIAADGVSCECPVGQTPAGTSCVPCAADSFKDEAGAGDCISCPAGSGTNEETGATALSQCLCAPGQNLVQTECKNCGPGRYSANGGPCVDCPSGSITVLEGSFHSGEAATGCLLCETGRFSANSTTNCTACDPGSITVLADDSFTSSAGASHCLPCGPGRFSSSSIVDCTDCSPGSAAMGPQGVVSEAATSCLACEPGRYSADSTVECADCDAGTFLASSGGASCDNCSVGTHAPPGSSLCVNCAAGLVDLDQNPASECTSCAVGSISSEAQTECVDCDAGWATEDGVACELCSLRGAGWMANTHRSACMPPCGEGHWRTSVDHPCNACPIGRYIPSVGQTLTDCIYCPANSDTDGVGKIERGDCTCLPGYEGDPAIVRQSSSARQPHYFPDQAETNCGGVSRLDGDASAMSPGGSTVTVDFTPTDFNWRV
eukprot:COSAG02_NODE_9114_length_2325_cov_1.515723_1_plen_503_part_10